MKKTLLSLILTLLVTVGFAQWSYFAESEWLGQTGDLTETSDGGFATASWTTTNPTATVTKLDANGLEEWVTTIEHPGFNDYANSIMETPDGGLIVAGDENYWSRPFAAKVDATGSVVWTSFAWADTMESDFSAGKAVLLGSGDLALIGTSLLGASFKVHVIDAEDGSLLDTHVGDTITGGLFFFTSVDDITATSDGGFAITGRTFDPALEQVYYLAKYDSDANLEWSGVHYTDGAALAYGLTEADGGGFYVAGQSDNSIFIPESESFLALHATDGSQTWIQYYDTGVEYPTGYDVAQLADGNLVMIEGGGSLIFPTLTEEARILHMDSAGTLYDEQYIGGISVVSMFNIYATSDGGFITGGLVGEDSVTMTTNFTAVIKSDAAGMLPDCLFNCVWPGDADNDGLANTDDILALGVASGSSGPARDYNSIEWYAHSATTWEDTLAGGSDLKYADCNGDGIINDDDTTAVSLNYGYEHEVYELRTAEGDVPMFVDVPEEVLTSGPFSFPVHLGTEADFPDEIYGVRFTITYEGDALDPESISFQFADNWFGTAAEEIRFRRNNGELGRLDVALVRNDQSNVTGWGEIGELSGIVIDNIAGRGRSTSILFNVTDIRAIDVNYNEITVAGETAEAEVEEGETTGLDAEMQEMVGIYPNPVTGNQLVIDAAQGVQPEMVIITDLQGAVVEQENLTGMQTMDITSLPAGTYMATIIWSGGRAVHAFIRQ